MKIKLWFAVSIATMSFFGTHALHATPEDEAQWKKLDITGDGWLDGTELNGGWIKFDADGNREVTKAEFMTGMAKQRQSVTFPATAADADKKFKESDVTGNGYLTGNEIALAGAERYDLNNDRNITREEYLVGWAMDAAKGGPPPAPSTAPVPVAPVVAPRALPADLPDATALRLVPPLGHTDSVLDVAITADGRYSLTGSRDSDAVLWETATGRELRRFHGHAMKVRCVALSPDGRFALTGSNDSTMRLWDILTAHEIRQFKGHSHWVTALAFSPDGKFILSGSYDHSIRLWDTATGAQLWAKEGLRNISSVAFSPNGQQALSGSDDKTMRLWNVANGTEIRQFTGHEVGVGAVAWSPDGKSVVSAEGEEGPSEPATIRLWDVATGGLIRQFTGHTKAISRIVFTARGDRLVSISPDNTMRVWNVADSKQVRAISIAAAGTSSSSGSPSFALDKSETFALASSSGSRAVLIHLASGQIVQSFSGRSSQPTSIAISPDGRFIASAAQKEVVLWDIARGQEIRRWNTGEYVWSVTWSADSRQVFSASYDGPVIAWDANTGQATRRFERKDGSTQTRVVASPDGRLIAASGKVLHIWDARNGQELRSFSAIEGFNELDFSPDSKYLVAGLREDKPLARMWDVTTGRVVHTFDGHTDHVWFVDFSPDGKHVLTSSSDETIRLWDTTTGREVRQLKIPAPELVMTSREWYYPIAFSPDGKNIAIGSPDNQVRLWDTITGQVRAIGAHTGELSSVLWSRDGRYLISGGWDNTLRAWDTQNNSLLFVRLALDDGDWLVYTPDGRFDGSPGGIRKCHFVRGMQTFAVEQFAERFYTPDLISLVLSGEKAPQQSAEQTLLAGEPPAVRIVSPTTGAAGGEQIEVAVEATQRNGGGVKAIRLYHNGRLVNGPGNLRGIVVEAATPEVAAPAAALTKRFTLQLMPGINTVRAVGYSRTDMESAPAEIALTWNKPEPLKPVLHVLAIGINDYHERGLLLNFARPDAEAVAGFFDATAKASGLFREARVVSLYDKAATGAAVREALVRLAAQTKPEDVVFLYLAGHGATVGTPQDAGGQLFYFLPVDAKSITDPELIRTSGVSFHEVADILATMKAQRVVLAYDACKSGAAARSALSRGSQTLAVLARAQGIHILTASTDQQLAQEDQVLGHGVFTYALLAGMEGKARAQGESEVSVLDLTAYTARRVRQIIEERRLRPQVLMPFNFGPDFPLIGATK